MRLASKYAVIAISGKQYSGKDTMCCALQRYLPDFDRVGCADALKDEYAIMSGRPRQLLDDPKYKDETVRAELIGLGKARRVQDVNYWVDKVLESDGKYIIIPDIRFQSEMDRLLDRAEQGEVHEIFTIRMEAPRRLRAERGLLSCEGDPSETELDGFNFDFVIENSFPDETVIPLEYQAILIANYVRGSLGLPGLWFSGSLEVKEGNIL